MKCYVGLDVGLRSTSLCIIDGDGTVRLERTIASEAEDIAGAIRSRGGAIEGVALETGNLTPWLATTLRAEGIRVVVLEARQVKTTLSSMRVQCLQGLVDRRSRIVAVELIEVDVIGAEPSKRGVDRVEDVLARHALIPGLGPHCSDTLGRQDELVAFAP
jgi:Transposase